jgi:hypothetical protein
VDLLAIMPFLAYKYRRALQRRTGDSYRKSRDFKTPQKRKEIMIKHGQRREP